ncbi:hypothetical protein LTR84_003679 [Exophiala bonariae]|uniref:Transcription factor domain-containing protein n=1 Tax=Exophiala bonariae TaxID=1690606 RepID=A0AAV9N9Y0_9EURO|nr:hypothetical protein LTR84_003679 [Exophiala bonariae]
MPQSTFKPNLVWVDGATTPQSKKQWRSHIVREGYRRKHIRAREGFSVLGSKSNTILQKDGLSEKSPRSNSAIRRDVQVPWAYFSLCDALSTYRHDYFHSLPMHLDHIEESQVHSYIQLQFKCWPDEFYYFTRKYGSSPFALAVELGLQDPTAFRILVSRPLERARKIRAGLANQVDTVRAISDRISSPETRGSDLLLNAVLSLITRMWTVRAESATIVAHFQGFRSLFLLRPRPWQISNRIFEKRLITSEICYNDACWSFVCQPSSYAHRVKQFSAFLQALRTLKSDLNVQRMPLLKEQGSSELLLLHRFLSKPVPMVWSLGHFNDESLAQISVLLLICATLLDNQANRRKQDQFSAHLHSLVTLRGLGYDESQWCLFWILFFGNDSPTEFDSQERVWIVLRLMNVVKTLSIVNRGNVRTFLLSILTRNDATTQEGSDIDVGSIETELLGGPVPCLMCGSRTTFAGAHAHSSTCIDPNCWDHSSVHVGLPKSAEVSAIP